MLSIQALLSSLPFCCVGTETSETSETLDNRSLVGRMLYFQNVAIFDEHILLPLRILTIEIVVVYHVRQTE